MTVHRTGGSAARLAKSLRPLHDTRHADLKDGSDRANGLASHNPRHSTISQIHRVGSWHHRRPPSGRQFESDLQPKGNPTRFKPNSSRSRATSVQMESPGG